MTDLERLKAAYETILNIVRTREDGARFLPIVQRLKTELIMAEDQAALLARIMDGAEV